VHDDENLAKVAAFRKPLRTTARRRAGRLVSMIVAQHSHNRTRVTITRLFGKRHYFYVEHTDRLIGTGELSEIPADAPSDAFAGIALKVLLAVEPRLDAGEGVDPIVKRVSSLTLEDATRFRQVVESIELEGGLYTLLEREERAKEGLKPFIITSPFGQRVWWAENADHAEEQHENAFGDDRDEVIIGDPEEGE
jgi:hypothetical protein